MFMIFALRAKRVLFGFCSFASFVISLHGCLRSEADVGLVNPRRIAAGHVVIFAGAKVQGWQGLLAKASRGHRYLDQT